MRAILNAVGAISISMSEASKDEGIVIMETITSIMKCAMITL